MPRSGTCFASRCPLRCVRLFQSCMVACYQPCLAVQYRMQLPLEVPVMTLPSATLFPQALLPLYIFEPRYRKMLADSLKSHRMFTVAMQKPGHMREAPCVVAGLGLIRVSVDHPD